MHTLDPFMASEIVDPLSFRIWFQICCTHIIYFNIILIRVILWLSLKELIPHDFGRISNHWRVPKLLTNWVSNGLIMLGFKIHNSSILFPIFMYKSDPWIQKLDKFVSINLKNNNIIWNSLCAIMWSFQRKLKAL